MADILEFEEQCMKYLSSLYDCFAENPNTIAVSKYALAEKLNFNQVLTDRIVKRLLNKGAVKGEENQSIKITPHGVDQLIAYQRQDHKMISSSNYNVNVASMTGSNIVQGSQGVSITTTMTNTQTEEVGKIVSALRSIIPAPELTEEKKAELEVEIQTLDIQLKSPKPKLEQVKDCLTSAKNILEGISIGAVVVSRITTFLSILE